MLEGRTVVVQTLSLGVQFPDDVDDGDDGLGTVEIGFRRG